MSNFIDIYISERKKPVPVSCEICDNTLQSLEDAVCAYNEGSCKDCFISFVEPNRNMLGENWKPSKKEIDDWLLKKNVQFKPMYKFF